MTAILRQSIIVSSSYLYLNHIVYLVLAAKFHLNNCSISNDKPAEKVVPLVAGELL